jgi:hypothetical protein
MWNSLSINKASRGSAHPPRVELNDAFDQIEPYGKGQPQLS